MLNLLKKNNKAESISKMVKPEVNDFIHKGINYDLQLRICVDQIELREKIKDPQGVMYWKGKMSIWATVKENLKSN